MSDVKKTLTKSLRDIRMSKLKIKMDLTTLDMIIGFLYKDSVLRTRKTMNNIMKLMNSLDLTIYENDNNEPYIISRIWIIQKTLEARLVEGFANDEMIKKYCEDHVDCDEYKKEVLKETIEKGKKITHDESKYLIKQIDDRLNFGYTVTLKEVFNELLSKLDEEDFRTYRSVEDDLYQIASSVINIRRATSSLGSDQTFSLQEEIFQTVVSDALDRLKDRNRIFITGIRRWNTILSPGYMSKRLYTYLAFPGGGKSQILLKSALDIRKYNTRIQTKNPDARPAVLFITMENSIEETVERIFNMTSSSDDIRNYTQKQVMKKLKDSGGLTLTDKNNIDIIIKYYDNRSIDTNDLYGIIQDMEDEGIETVALILDYLKRIKPAEKGANEKEELKNITNELKSLANFFDIPVNKIAA